MTRDTYEAMCALRESGMTWQQVADRVGYHESWCRAVYAGRGGVKELPVKRTDWYALAARVVTETCESIDSVCRRLELNPQVLIRRMYDQ